MELQSSVCDAATLLLLSQCHENLLWKPLHCFPGLKVCLVLSAPGNGKLKFEEKPLVVLLEPCWRVGVSVATETTLLPHLLMEAWCTSRCIPALSCKFILEKCSLTFQIRLCHFLGIPSWVLTNSRKLLVCCFRSTDFYLASVCEDLTPLSCLNHVYACLPCSISEFFYYAAFKNYMDLK